MYQPSKPVSPPAPYRIDKSISYAHIIESQHMRLIQALQKVHRDVRQFVKEEDMNEIVQIVKACGFDFENMKDPKSNIKDGVFEVMHSDVKQNDTSPSVGSTCKGSKVRDGNAEDLQLGTCDGIVTLPKKRKRAKIDGQLGRAPARNGGACTE